MARAPLVLTTVILTACGGDIASSGTAAEASASVDARTEAMAPGFGNPVIVACLREATSDEEFTIMEAGQAGAEETLAEVMTRQALDACLIRNNAVLIL